MERNIIHNKDLDSRMKEIPVKVTISTSEGIEYKEGHIKDVIIPWNLEMYFKDDSSLLYKQPFACLTSGIIKIEQGGKTLYYNNKLPVPYPNIPLPVDLFLSSEENKKLTKRSYGILNELREELFGKGFEY